MTSPRLTPIRSWMRRASFGSAWARQGALDGRGALHGIDHAGELDQRAVAHQLDDAAMILGDRRIDHLAPAVLQPRQRARFVLAHHAAVTGHIGHENGG